MSTVTGSALRRWSVVAAATAALVGVPALAPGVLAIADRLSGAAPRTPAPQVLLRSVLASAGVAHQGLAQARGGLGLPDLPRLGSASSLLGGTTRMRVWWSSAQDWRVAVPTGTGEQDVYGPESALETWDYEDDEVTIVRDISPLRLPRADDLLPPQLARRLLAASGGGDVLTSLPVRRVAGHETVGVRLSPGDARSTVGHVDVWADPSSGLPLAVDVVDRRGADVLTSSFLQVDLTTPAASVIAPPSAPGIRRNATSEPDLASFMNRLAPWRLPRTLAGLPASTSPFAGVASYGSGFVRFVVIPLRPRLAREALDAARRNGGSALKVDGGRAWLLSSGVLQIAVAGGQDDVHAYLVAGLVSGDLLRTAVAELLAHPPAASS